jgi:hypothetical protein
MSCKTILLPLLPDKSAGSEFGRAESARRVLGRIAWKHWAEERRIKQTIYTPSSPPSPSREKGQRCGITHGLTVGVVTYIGASLQNML